MAAIDSLVQDFLAQKHIAVAGVSAKRDDLPANGIVRLLRSRGYQVYAVSPHCTELDGEPCYPTIQAIPVVPDGVIVVTQPAVTMEIVQQCVDAGVTRVWMHDMRGTLPKFAKESGEKITSVSAEAVQLCRDNGIAVIPGSCPRQFIGDFGHKCMCWTLRLFGALEVPVRESKAV